MGTDDVMQRLKTILTRDFRVPESRITPDATFRGTLGMDSLDAVDLVYLVCKDFGLKPDLEPFRSLDTVQKVADYLAAQTSP